MKTDLTHEARQREDGEVRPSRMEQTGAPRADATQIAFILDRSGSMGSMAQEAIGGFNAFLKEQQKEKGEARLSLILFDHEYTPVVENRPIEEVRPLNAKSYEPRGMTALLDAMGRTIDDLGKQLAEMPERERPGTVIVVTLTDGLENSSQEYTYDRLGEMIEHQKDAYNWEFLFLGSNLENTQQSARFNMKQDEMHACESVSENIAYSSGHISKRRREVRDARKKNKIGF
jgi:Mg-chelatase subunit ChlD